MWGQNYGVSLLCKCMSSVRYLCDSTIVFVCMWVCTLSAPLFSSQNSRVYFVFQPIYYREYTLLLSQYSASFPSSSTQNFPYCPTLTVFLAIILWLVLFSGFNVILTSPNVFVLLSRLLVTVSILIIPTFLILISLPSRCLVCSTTIYFKRFLGIHSYFRFLLWIQ